MSDRRPREAAGQDCVAGQPPILDSRVSPQRAGQHLMRAFGSKEQATFRFRLGDPAAERQTRGGSVAAIGGEAESMWEQFPQIFTSATRNGRAWGHSEHNETIALVCSGARACRIQDSTVVWCVYGVSECPRPTCDPVGQAGDCGLVP